MDLQLKDKVALVTGSSRGIGLAIAKRLYDEGCFIILNGRGLVQQEKLAHEFKDRFAYVQADVTQAEECERLIKTVINKYKKLDVLVCNVGDGASVKPGEETYEEWLRVLHINLLAATNMITKATSSLTTTKGSIVCVSSICGCETILGAPLTYSAAKAALNSFVRGVARPLGKKGVRINAVAPGNILFTDSVWEKKLAEDEKNVVAMLKEKVALSRLGKAEEVADLATFLVSARAAFITGSVYVVDGGQVRS
jgi:3-oxoacyl-[acyl-carrier protein] reductase